MKIIFICGSLEPGRDGVGDYVRQLAGELANQGHLATALALSDPYITSKVEETQIINSVELQVLRLPFNSSYKLKLRLAKPWLDTINPEWVSIQYVPYSFHAKGLPFGLSQHLVKFCEGRKCHIMFHELWVGMEIGASKKLIFWGMVQRYLIRSLLKNLLPKIIHTQNNLYQAQLTLLGFNSVYLPLFTNIPLAVSSSKLLSNKNVPLEHVSTISFVVFGSIHPNVPIELFAKEAAEYSKKYEVEVIMTLVGRCGNEQEHWVTEWKSAGLTIHVLGEKTPECISDILNKSTVGVATTPFALIEKSGSVAAMREHGLPILCVSRPWQPRGISDLKSPLGVWEYSYGNLETYLRNKPFFNKGSTISEVSQQFTRDLLNLI